MPEQYIIRGNITRADGADRAGVKVQAFDRDLPSLERRTDSVSKLLGDKEAITDAEGHFQITYTLEQFQIGEGISTFRGSTEQNADITFRVFDRTGGELTIKTIEALNREYLPDQIIFNAPTSLDVSIFLVGSQQAAPSEYEQIMSQLAPVIQDVPMSELSDDDLAFLSNELGLEQQRDVQQRIEWLRRCARLADETNLTIEAFYGWGRENVPAQLSELATVPLKNLPAVLDKLDGLRPERLHDALLAAIDGNIIPTGFRARVDEIVRQLTRRSQDLLQVNARLMDEETGALLASYTVTTFDRDAQDENLGLDITDQGGGFNFSVYKARGLPANASTHLIAFEIKGPNGEAPLETATITIDLNRVGSEVVLVKVKVPKAAVPSIEEQLQNAKVQPSPAVSKWLKDRGISTFADVRRRGGLSKVDGAPSADAALIRRLDCLADLDRISASAQASNVILDKGFDSVLAIADSPYSEFISLVSDESMLTQIEVAGLHVMATAQTTLLNNILLRMAVDSANGFELPAQPDNAAGGNS